MSLLVIDISDEVSELTIANRKRSITTLPIKTRVIAPLRFDPCRRRLFKFLEQFGLAHRAGQSCGDVNMIDNSSNPVSLARAIATDCCQICMHSGSNCGVEPWAPVLCAEDNMQDNLT